MKKVLYIKKYLGYSEPMKILILWMVSLGALCAQDITGTWQGTATAEGRDVRMVIKIVQDNGRLSATLYNIDANPRPVPASSVTLDGGALKITFVPGRLGYEGKEASDGNSIAGSLTRGPNSLPLSLARATPATAWNIPEPPPPPAAMAEDARLVYEVATIKPAPPDAQNMPYRVRPGQVEILNRTLVHLIQEAYNLHSSQILGAEGWIDSERYDITGKPEAAGVPNLEQLRQMLRNLLADRFQLKFHLEEKELPVYAIRMGKTGQHKLTPTAVQRPLGGGDFRGPGAFSGRHTSIANLAEALQSVVLDRPVVDQTGLTGRFDFLLRWRPDEFQYGGRGASMPKPPDADSLPDIFTAFEEQLGLRLEATKAPARVFVIDSAQKPSPN
jgi:uncharacterized protein (TIGR03435 family)